MIFEVALDGELLRASRPDAREWLVAIVRLFKVLVELNAGHESLVAVVVQTFEDIGVDVRVVVLLEVAPAREALVATWPVARIRLLASVSARDMCEKRTIG